MFAGRFNECDIASDQHLVMMGHFDSRILTGLVWRPVLSDEAIEVMVFNYCDEI
jgi:hypothetical protein